MDDSGGHIEALFIIAYEPTPVRHPAKGAFDDRAPRKVRGRVLVRQFVDDLHDEVQEGCLVVELAALVGAIGQQMLDLGPAPLERLKHFDGTGRFGDVGRRQTHHGRSAVSINSDVALAPGRSLGRIELVTGSCRGLDRLGVEDRSGWLERTLLELTAWHPGQVGDHLEENAAGEATEPRIHRLSRGNARPTSATRTPSAPANALAAGSTRVRSDRLGSSGL